MATATITKSEIEAMSGPELVEAFNSLTDGQPVKRFSTRQAGIKRVLAALKASSIPTGKADDGYSPASPTGVARRRRLSFPVKETIKDHRPNTKRARVIQMLSQQNGATLQQVMDALDWDYKTAFEGVKLLHEYVGYGLEEDDEGRIRLVET